MSSSVRSRTYATAVQESRATSALHIWRTSSRNSTRTLSVGSRRCCAHGPSNANVMRADAHAHHRFIENCYDAVEACADSHLTNSSTKALVSGLGERAHPRNLRDKYAAVLAVCFAPAHAFGPARVSVRSFPAGSPLTPLPLLPIWTYSIELARRRHHVLREAHWAAALPAEMLRMTSRSRALQCRKDELI